jgi:hypothetical protein
MLMTCSGAIRLAASGSEASYFRELSLRLREASARAWSRHLNQRETRFLVRSHHVVSRRMPGILET